MKTEMNLQELIDYFDIHSSDSIIKHKTRMVIINSLFRIKNQVTAALESKDNDEKLVRYLTEI